MYRRVRENHPVIKGLARGCGRGLGRGDRRPCGVSVGRRM
jgi:hypothetical protein